MNYAMARELTDKTGWHFTTMNDHVVRAATCCRTIVPATAEDVARLDWIYHGRLKAGDPITGPAHEAHRTREEAEACYHDWVVASVGLGWVAGERDDIDESRDAFVHWQGCESIIGWDEPRHYGGETAAVLCGEPTKKAAYYRDIAGPNTIPLCDNHYTVEVARTLVPRSTSITYS